MTTYILTNGKIINLEKYNHEDYVVSMGDGLAQIRFKWGTILPILKESHNLVDLFSEILIINKMNQKRWIFTNVKEINRFDLENNEYYGRILFNKDSITVAKKVENGWELIDENDK